MARILPKGATVDMGIEDPLDKLNRVLNVVSRVQNISQNYQQSQLRKDKSLLTSLTAVGNFAANAKNSEDLEYAQGLFNQLNQADARTDSTRLIFGATERELNTKKQRFDSIQISGQNVANSFNTQHLVKNEDGEESSKYIREMDKYEIQNYFNDLVETKGNGAYGVITKEIENVEKLYLQLAGEFGFTNKGTFNITPGFTFEDNNGNKIAPTDYLMNLERYKDRLNMFVEAGFRDGFLTIEEAQLIVGGKYNEYSAVRQAKGEQFKFEAQNLNSTIRNLDTKIAQYAQDDDKLEEAIDIITPDIINSLIKADNPNSGFPVSSDEEQYKKNAAVFLGKQNKEDVLRYFNAYRDAIGNEMTAAKERMNNWGFNYLGSVSEDQEKSIFQKAKTNISQTPQKIDDDFDFETRFTEDDVSIEPPIAANYDNLTDAQKKQVEDYQNKGVTFSEAFVPATIGTLSVGAATYLYGNNVLNFGKDLMSATQLPNEAIDDFINDKSKLTKNFKSKENKLKETLEKRNEQIDKNNPNDKNAAKAQKQSAKNVTDKKINKNRKNFIKAFSKEYKVNPTDVQRLFEKGVDDKWYNLYKSKLFLSGKYKDFTSRVNKFNARAARVVPGATVGVTLGSYLPYGDTWTGLGLYGVTGVGAQKLSKKAFDKFMSNPKNAAKFAKYTNKFNKSMMTAVGKVIGKSLPKKIATTLSSAAVTGPGSVVVALTQAGLLANDIYQVIDLMSQDVKLTDAEIQAIRESDEYKQMQNEEMINIRKMAQDPNRLMEPTTRFNK